MSIQDDHKITLSVSNDEVEEGELPTDNALSPHQNISKVMHYLRLIYWDFNNITQTFCFLYS